MAVSILGTPSNLVEAGTYTAETGSNRLLVICSGVEQASGAGALSCTAMSFGTASLANGKIISAKETQTTGTQKVLAGIWYIKEADIPAGSNAISATFTSDPGAGHAFVLYTLDGVDQSNPVEATSQFTVNIGSETDPWSSSINVAANTAQILQAIVDVNVASTASAGWTEQRDVSRSLYQFVTHHIVSASAGSVTYGLDFAAVQAGAISVVSFGPVAGQPARIRGRGIPGMTQKPMFARGF